MFDSSRNKNSILFKTMLILACFTDLIDIFCILFHKTLKMFRLGGHPYKAHSPLTPPGCTRGSCLDYPNFKSLSQPTHETSRISMATLSLSQLYYKHRRRLPWCTGAMFFTELRQEQRDSKLWFNSLIFPFGQKQNVKKPIHHLLSSFNRTESSREDRVDRVQVPYVTCVSTSYIWAQFSHTETSCSHSIYCSDPWEWCKKTKQMGFNIYYVTSCHVYYSCHEVCSRAQGKSYYFSTYIY